MLWLAFRNLLRRPLRTALTIAGLSIGVAVLAALFSFGAGYKRALSTELDRMGVQMMLVPLGCPYDAAARVIKGKDLENSLPAAALDEARRDPAVAVAAPLLMAALPRAGQGRADMWVGLDESALKLKPWWRAKLGAPWFPDDQSVILGCDAAEIEMRTPGDLFFSPETRTQLKVAGVLERSGTSDDSLFFVPLRTAQKMFGQTDRLTAIAIRLRDPELLRDATQRLQQIPGAQVVTLTEMMGTFLSLVGAIRTLLIAIAVVALAVGVLSVFNTLLGSVVERTNELSIMRALGASPAQVIRLISTEALLLAGIGSLLGIGMAILGGQGLESLIKDFVPLAPAQPLLSPSLIVALESLALGIAAGLIGSLYPAWRASRLQPALALTLQ